MIEQGVNSFDEACRRLLQDVKHMTGKPRNPGAIVAKLERLKELLSEDEKDKHGKNIQEQINRLRKFK